MLARRPQPLIPRTENRNSGNSRRSIRPARAALTLSRVSIIEPSTLPFWRTLQGLIETIGRGFGCPPDIAKHPFLSRADHKIWCDLLRPMEVLMRRLLFIAALAAPAPAPPPKAKPRKASAHNPAPRFDPERPETWRPRFDLGIRYPGRTRRGARRPSTPLAYLPSAPLALRFEAIIRGFNTPAPLVARIARHLARQPQTARCFLAKPEARLMNHYPVIADTLAFARSEHARLREAPADTS